MVRGGRAALLRETARIGRPLDIAEPMGVYGEPQNLSIDRHGTRTPFANVCEA
jgi:hypothetical protein